MRYIALTLVGFFLLSGSLAAQGQDQTIATDPIRCWWRTSTAAVRTGETFRLVLTCAVLEADAVRVVPDESRLTDAVIQLAPFEVIGGSHPPDVRSGNRRFFQYEYQVRALNSDLIGLDVPLPNLTIGYRVNSRLPGNASLEGRDLSYLLPPHRVRVLSLVPADAADIRDTPDVTFDRIESLRVRAGMLDIVALTLIVLGSVMTLVAVIGLARGRRVKERSGEHTIGARTVLAAAEAELNAVQREGEGSWSDALLDRAMSAARVAAAAALDRPLHQRTARTPQNGEGRLIVRGWARRRPVEVSSAVTSEDLARALARLRSDAPERECLDNLRGALTTLTAAQYARQPARDASAINDAIQTAAAATRALKNERIWPRERLRQWRADRAATERP